MSDQPRRRLRKVPAPRRVGEPNVLSNQATPNVLSTEGSPARAPASAGAVAPATAPARPAAARPVTVTDRTPPPASAEAPARTLRAPSLSTIIFVGFLLFTAARFIGNFGADEADPTTAPGPADVGVITFGLGLGDDCKLLEPAETFGRSDEVWWRAEMILEQDADAEVVVRAYHDEGQIERYEVPPEPEFGDWDVLCAGEPIGANQAGAYRVEVWDGAEKVLLATGVYTKTE